jgi:purine-binding chemotaxis protein CheW
MLKTFINTCRNALKPRAQTALQHRYCLTFALNGIRFGIDARTVIEIARYRILAEPRCLPHFMRGVFRHDGRMIPVIDIGARYGKQPAQPGGRTCIVLIELGSGKWRREIGIMVDEIFGMAVFSASELLPVPELAHQMLEVKIIEGMLKQEKDYLVLIDVWRLLPDAELETLAAYMRQY